jgi:dinuclear metal center YbgI/SA1388 family protein
MVSMSNPINVNPSICRIELLQYLSEYLALSRYKDYCPNGLQVEGKPTISRIVAGVSASQRFLDEAVLLKADAVLVHHGYFWKGENACLTGHRRQRIKTLLAQDINLLAYHLPLDGHPEIGNNAQLAKLFDWKVTGRFGDQDLGFLGELDIPITQAALQDRCRNRLNRTPMVIGDDINKVIRKIAWCSGGGDGYFEAATALGVDAFFSGEISEPAVHLARESGVSYFSAGHHATERYGVKALAEHLALQFDIEAIFVDIDNPA